MNSASLINLVLLYFKLNGGIGNDAKVIMKEGMDVINALTKALKDNKITNAEKKALVAELEEFSNAVIELIDNITIPE
jgi:ribosome recycling factor